MGIATAVLLKSALLITGNSVKGAISHLQKKITTRKLCGCLLVERHLVKILILRITEIVFSLITLSQVYDFESHLV